MAEATRVRNNPDLELLSTCRERCIHQDRYRVVGASFSICCESEEAAERIRPFLATFWQDQPLNEVSLAPLYVLGDGRRGYRVVNCAGRSIQSPWWQVAFSYLFSMMHAQLWSASARLLPLHSAAVSIGGQGLLLPGDSGQGKSTLALELAIHGCDYLSDEFAPICLSTGQVLPYPRPLQISQEAASLLLDGLVAPGLSEAAFLDDEGAERRLLDPRAALSLGEAAPVRHIIVLEGFAENASLAHLSKAEALGRLSASAIVYQTSAAWKKAAVKTLTNLVENAGCHALRLGPIGANHAVLKDLASSDPQETTSREAEEREDLKLLASRIQELLRSREPCDVRTSRVRGG